MTMSYNTEGPGEPIDADKAREEAHRRITRNAAILARQSLHRAFTATPIGAAFETWEKAHAAYWQADGFPDTSHKRLVNLAAHERAVYEDLLELLYRAAGVAQEGGAS